MAKKEQLAGALADKMGVSKREASDWIDAFVDQVSDFLRKGEEVNITGFGAFSVAHRAARTGRNPQTGESLQIPAKNVPKFKAGKVLKEAVK